MIDKLIVDIEEIRKRLDTQSQMLSHLMNDIGDNRTEINKLLERIEQLENKENDINE